MDLTSNYKINYAIVTNDFLFAKMLLKKKKIDFVLVPIRILKRTVSDYRIGIRWSYFQFKHRCKVIFVDFNDFAYTQNIIECFKIDSFIIYSMPYLIDKRILTLLTSDPINLHPSYLPYYKGPSPIINCILDNSRLGFTIHFVDEFEDHGPIIHREYLDIGIEDYYRLDKIIITNGVSKIYDYINSPNKYSLIVQNEINNLPLKRAKRFSDRDLKKLISEDLVDLDTTRKILFYRPLVLKLLIDKDNYSSVYEYSLCSGKKCMSLNSIDIYYSKRISLKLLYEFFRDKLQ